MDYRKGLLILIFNIFYISCAQKPAKKNMQNWVTPIIDYFTSFIQENINQNDGNENINQNDDNNYQSIDDNNLNNYQDVNQNDGSYYQDVNQNDRSYYQDINQNDRSYYQNINQNDEYYYQDINQNDESYYQNTYQNNRNNYQNINQNNRNTYKKDYQMPFENNKINRDEKHDNTENDFFEKIKKNKKQNNSKYSFVINKSKNKTIIDGLNRSASSTNNDEKLTTSKSIFSEEKEEKEFLELEKVFEELGEGISNITQNTIENAVIFIGPTGAGKSTTVDLLLGAPLKKIMKDDYEYIIDVDKNNISNRKYAKIGHTFISETLVPEVYNLYISEKLKNVSLCDCPGFFDNRSQKETFIATFCNNILFKRVKSIKALFFVLDYNSLESSRGKDFMEGVLEPLEMIFKNKYLYKTIIDGLNKSTPFTNNDEKFTRSESTFSKETIIDGLNKSTPFANNDEKFTRSESTFLEENQENIDPFASIYLLFTKTKKGIKSKHIYSQLKNYRKAFKEQNSIKIHCFDKILANTKNIYVVNPITNKENDQVINKKMRDRLIKAIVDSKKIPKHILNFIGERAAYEKIKSYVLAVLNKTNFALKALVEQIPKNIEDIENDKMKLEDLLYHQKKEHKKKEECFERNKKKKKFKIEKKIDDLNNEINEKINEKKLFYEDMSFNLIERLANLGKEKELLIENKGEIENRRITHWFSLCKNKSDIDEILEYYYYSYNVETDESKKPKAYYFPDFMEKQRIKYAELDTLKIQQEDLKRRLEIIDNKKNYLNERINSKNCKILEVRRKLQKISKSEKEKIESFKYKLFNRFSVKKEMFHNEYKEFISLNESRIEESLKKINNMNFRLIILDTQLDDELMLKNKYMNLIQKYSKQIELIKRIEDIFPMNIEDIKGFLNRYEYLISSIK